MAADPKTLPAAVVKKVREVADRRGGTEPFEVTATLEIDPATGKILDAFFVAGWTKDENGELQPKFSTVRQCMYIDGSKQFATYGKIPKPAVHTE